MFCSSVLSVLIAIAPAFASLTDEQRQSYTGLSRDGFPYPYICDGLAPKLTEPFASLSDAEKKEWLGRYFSVIDPTDRGIALEGSEFREPYTECTGFKSGDNIVDLYYARRTLLNRGEMNAINAKRVANGKSAEAEIQEWREEKGLPKLEKA